MIKGAFIGASIVLAVLALEKAPVLAISELKKQINRQPVQARALIAWKVLRGIL